MLFYIISVQEWDQTSAYIGATGSRYQSITADLTQPTQPMNHEIAQRRDQHTGTSIPYSLRLVCRFFDVPQGYDN